jgi:two-component system response regulator NreC
MRKITIVQADDHNMVREGLRAVLDSQPDFSVIGEASDGLDAVRVVERMRPNVLVADVFMAGLNGVEVVRQVAERSPTTRTLVLSVESDESYIADALANGAAGYMIKDAPAIELIQAIREIAAGKRYLSPTLSEAALSAYVKRSRTDELDLYKKLTVREREVLHLAAQGVTNTEIGKRLFISPRTVEVHRASMMRKLGLKNPIQLILYAIKRGIVSSHEHTDEIAAKREPQPSRNTTQQRKIPAHAKHPRRS